jgi:hypothetical protein
VVIGVDSNAAVDLNGSRDQVNIFREAEDAKPCDIIPCCVGFSSVVPLLMPSSGGQANRSGPRIRWANTPQSEIDCAEAITTDTASYRVPGNTLAKWRESCEARRARAIGGSS